VRNGFWGWGTAFFDYDNDGDLDLVMTNGVDFPETERETRFHDDPLRFWENDGSGAMTEVSAEVGLTDTGSGKGLLVFDYDDDGDLDLLVVNNAATPKLYRNDGGNRRDWLRVQVQGTTSNREGLGARVHLYPRQGGPAQTREVGSASHFLGQGERTVHFGLGRSGRGRGPLQHMRVVVEWPAGGVQEFRNVPHNATLVAREPARVAVPRCGSADWELVLAFLARWARLRSGGPIDA
jgi:hypothetical protein